jgi:diaminohydroxyphosphoribosylaminopyrimidine deaminase / 5-amino-6-(5-phosphoribosylamino)uracil reductase
MDYMEQAVSLARLALGQVSPNPAVGAVVVKDDVVVGQGYTQPPGSDHAEIVALKQAGGMARGAVMYVTLEPCCHFGRTPPCTEAIIAAGIKEVRFSMVDPNPIVAGKGQTQLETAGIQTYIGDHAAEAAETNEAFIKFITTGTPFITAKYASSLDGKIATRSGDSHWITGEAARKEVQALRYISDAIIVGANTVITDNPHLTVRYNEKGGTAKKQPLRVIVDGKASIPATAGIFSEPGKTLVVTGEGVPPEKKKSYISAGAEVLELPWQTSDQVDLKLLMKILGGRQITSILVEGGGMLLGSLFDNGLVDKVVAFVAPIIIGGEGARTAVAGQGVGKIADSTRLKKVRVEAVGPDIMVSGYVERS